MAKNTQSDLVQPNERVDDLQNGFYVIQNPEKFCFGMDAVLLSGFANIRKNETVLDMGTGTGIIPILLKSKGKGGHLTGLEIQEECADMWIMYGLGISTRRRAYWNRRRSGETWATGWDRRITRMTKH